MASPYLRIQTSDGHLSTLGPDAIIGRSSAAALRLADPRVSSVHAELSWRADGPCLLARGGRLLVNGRPAAEVPLAPGQRVSLVPGLELLVVDVVEGEVSPTAPTLGRDAVRWRVGATEVAVEPPGGAPMRITGLAGRLLAGCLAVEHARPWTEVAAELWPDEARIRAGLDPSSRWTDEDERRLRNRWDQLVRALRLQLAPRGLDARLECGGGSVRVRREARDQVVAEGGGA
ncbi:FHA domain-containing protein [Myxococcota bacterium]|nr:FHA domain-containing protein [Myxococcota bacterium]